MDFDDHSRREFLKRMGLTTACFALPAAATAQAGGNKKNLIFIMADDLGYGDLGCYGQKRIKTPNIDRMAAEGMKFADHYSGSTVCAPSRCTLMTGLHTGHCRVRSNGSGPLRPGDVTVAEVLTKAGYNCGLIGKWGLGEGDSTGAPLKQGFEHFFGYLNQIHAHNYFPRFLWRNDKKMKLRNEVVIAKSGYAKGIGGAATKRVDYSHDLMAEDAVDFIERNSKKPFFLYLAFTLPHANNEGHVVKRHGMEVPDYGIYKTKDWPDAQKGHAAMISRLDRDVGRVLDKLKKLGIEKDTLVIFTSDNGPHREGGADPKFFDSNGPLRGIKRDLYEGGIRVPMIARWPGTIKPRTTSDHPSAFWDLLPTACDVAGVAPSEDIDGISYLPEMLGRKQKRHEHLYWEYRGKQALRVGKWKAVKVRGKLELYDLNEDISEKNDIAGEHPDVVRKMAKLFQTARTKPN